MKKGTVSQIIANSLKIQGVIFTRLYQTWNSCYVPKLHSKEGVDSSGPESGSSVSDTMGMPDTDGTSLMDYVIGHNWLSIQSGTCDEQSWERVLRNLQEMTLTGLNQPCAGI